MEDRYTYDPEDLESLLLHKDFNDLYPDEKAFVLKHLSGAEEYADMQQTMRLLGELSPGDPMQPSRDRKESVMSAYRNTQNKRVWFSLNSIFSFLVIPERNLFRQPVFQLAVLFVLIASSLWWYNDISVHEHASQLAEIEVKDLKDEAPQKEATVNENTSAVEVTQEHIESLEAASPTESDDTFDKGSNEVTESIEIEREIEEVKVTEEETEEEMQGAAVPAFDENEGDIQMTVESAVAFSEILQVEDLTIPSVESVARTSTQQQMSSDAQLDQTEENVTLKTTKVRSQESLIAYFYTAM